LIHSCKQKTAAKNSEIAQKLNINPLNDKILKEPNREAGQQGGFPEINDPL
jgi:hypothetical protein